MKKSTRVNHPPAVELPPGNHAVVAPIYQTVKFEFDTLADTEAFLRGGRPGFYYTRASNPTTRQLEQLLAELQGREDCLVTASGVGAIASTRTYAALHWTGVCALGACISATALVLWALTSA